jgi:hypothetical protein
MAAQKKKIVIIEDIYRQFQIIRELLRNDYEILPDIKTEREFRLLRSDLMCFLNGEDKVFLPELDNYKNIDAFIVDYDLKQDSYKNGILFCKQTDCISDGLKPVLFLTIVSKAEVENTIRNVRGEIPKIVFDNLRKPELWGDDSEKIDSIVGNSGSSYLKTVIIKKITELIEKSGQNKKNFKTTSE